MNINIWAVLVASLAKFIIGFLWYSPYLFGTFWMQDVGLMQDKLSSPNRSRAIAAVAGFVMAFTMAVVINLGHLGFLQSLALGVLMATGIMAAQMAPQLVYEGRSFRLYSVYVGQYIVELVVMAAIIGGWR